MERHCISTDNAPAAIGPYSQAIVAGGFVFCSGTVGIDPNTGLLPEGLAEQTEQALLNLAAILESAGSSIDRSSRRRSFTQTSKISPPSTRSMHATCPIPRQPGRLPPMLRCREVY
jgi:enamine deaminase RidA (YjgF/YER057c/UK114 family)